MLTPLDIQNKEFTKGFRGYAEIEVDSFLDEVISDYEHIFKENLELKSKIDMLNEQIKHYGSIENTLQKTLVVAQTTAEDVVHTARTQGDAIIDESERRAEKIIESARDQVINSKKEYERIRKEILMFRTKYKTLLNSQLEALDHYSDDETNMLHLLEEMKQREFSHKTEDVNEQSHENVSDQIYASNLQGEENAYAQDAIDEEKQDVESNVASFKNQYAGVSYHDHEENPFRDVLKEQQEDSPFAIKINRQERHDQDKESLYVENLQENRNIESKISTKENEYEQEIQKIYSSMNKQLDDLSKYTKKPVLD